MHLFKRFLLLSIIFISFCVRADETCLVEKNDLTQQRITVISHYLDLLGQGDFKALPAFFDSKAIVSEAIKGLTTPQKYYNGLYQYLTHPMVTVYDIYPGVKNKDVYAAHFTMKIKDKSGAIKTRGQIVDLIVFEPNSTKFAKIYIQNNMTDYEFTT
jgi:hypothetical protein